MLTRHVLTRHMPSAPDAESQELRKRVEQLPLVDVTEACDSGLYARVLEKVKASLAGGVADVHAIAVGSRDAGAMKELRNGFELRDFVSSVGRSKGRVMVFNAEPVSSA
jgi:hypothetical protein